MRSTRALAVQVQGADVEPGELGDVPAVSATSAATAARADRGRRVGVDGPADGQVVKQALGLGRG